MNHLNEKGIRGFDREYRQKIQALLEEIRSSPISKTEKKSYLDGVPIFDICVRYPILEEVFFRLGLQNSINLLQRLLKYSFSDTRLQNKTITWLTSTTARISVVETLFAGIHFFNEGSLFQPLVILYSSSYSASYETTGTILTPIVLHILNNSSIQLFYGLIKTN
jgi:membrane protease YdiL (CAAX protease family)